jgi:amino acid transporter
MAMPRDSGLRAPSFRRQRVQLPEPLSYRLKRKLLGPPLVTERLAEERLSNPIALGVLAPDCISSTAYGSEEILTELVPAIGVAAFGLLMPITFAVIGVLFFVTLSYREVVMAYSRSGGAYMVTRENFGPRVAQIAAVALIIDYTVTVAVQTAAGTDAVTSAFPALKPYNLPMTVGVVVLLFYGNLRGIREAGRTFAVPTYLFIASTGAVIVTGVVKVLIGHLPAHSIHVAGALPAGRPGNGLLLGATMFTVLRSFANGGSSLTGLEAISNSVSTFRPPEGRNSRRVLVIMSSILGSLVLGVSFLAWKTHAVPFTGGSPTVLSQEAHFVFGNSVLGRVGYYFVQGATMLVLYTGANTSFNGFPNLASVVARDAFLPRQLTRRGHRLVFSNGIIILTAASIILLVVTRARVNSLVAVYAIGVFTGFTAAGAGMVRYHLRERRSGYHRRLLINAFASVLSAIVVLIFAVTKFAEGAWVVVVIAPILVLVLIRLHNTYTDEQEALETNVQKAAEAPVLRHHIVLVFVERFDLAVARALRYARSLSSEEPRAVHFVLDTAVARDLEEQWSRLGLSRFPLELVECPDRRLGRAAMEFCAELAADGESEVTVLLPRVVFDTPFRRVLHDNTGERIAGLVSDIPNVSATIIPFPLGRRRRVYLPDERELVEAVNELDGRGRELADEQGEIDQMVAADAPAGSTPIARLRSRQRARVAGHLRSVRIQPASGISSLEATIVDGSGQLLIVFQGRRLVPGIEPGARLLVEGMVGERGRSLVMINPAYTILASPSSGTSARR